MIIVPHNRDCQFYESSLYVSRPAIESQIETWLSEPLPQHSIRSLIGPPGTGKSWVLAHIRDINSTMCGKLYVQARDLLSVGLRDQFKMNLIRVANQCCPELRYPDDSLPSLQATIEYLSELMMQKCGSMYLLLLVDGCDDLETISAFDQVQETLADLVGDRNTCFRMLIARRSRLTHYRLRKSDRPIQVDVFGDQDGPGASAKQTRKLLLHAGKEPDTLALDSILPSGHHYQWNHPFINCFLLSRQIDGIPLTSNALRTCCLHLANRPIADEPMRHPAFGDDALDLLIELAGRLDKQWSSEEFKQIARRDLDIKDVRRGTIVNVRDNHGNITPLYSIADGLRELLKDIAEMQQLEIR